VTEPGDASGPDGAVTGRPEGEERAGRPGRRRRPRRAVRKGTNPSAQDLPDVVPPREEPAAGESPQDRWLREQRPPHWE
jgi:hypothetical protein